MVKTHSRQCRTDAIGAVLYCWHTVPQAAGHEHDAILLLLCERFNFLSNEHDTPETSFARKYPWAKQLYLHWTCGQKTGLSVPLRVAASKRGRMGSASRIAYPIKLSPCSCIM